MKPFRYEAATSAEEAVRTVAGSPTAAFLAGGTNLIDLMKLGVAAPEVLVDLTRLQGFTGIEETPAGGLRIGAGVANSDLAAHPAVRTRYPLLARALLAGASGQLRNMATVGGNLLQRTRCFYFQDPTKPCNKRRPGEGCSAREGNHRNLAILGGSEACIATHPSDMAVALVALDARVEVLDAGAGHRAAPLTDLYRLPGTEPHRETTLPHGALITAVMLPPLRFATNSTYVKVRDRASFSFAVASVAAALEVSGGMVSGIRLGLGAVAPVPWRAAAAEAALLGQAATAEAFEAAIDAELEAAIALRDNAFKVPLVRRLAVGVLGELAAGQP